MRLARFASTVLLVTAYMSAAHAQSPPGLPQNTAARDAMLKPGVQALRGGDATAAVEALRPVLAAYPNDPLVLSYSASAAMATKDYRTALIEFQRAIDNHAAQPWPLRMSVINLEAKLGMWPEFDRDLAVLRAAKKDGTDEQLTKTNGFIIEEFEAGGKTVQAVVFPALAGRYHTLYRFMLPSVAGVTPPANCPVTDFRAYIDVESDDVDQESFRKAHPDKAAKGERSYSLDTYPAPCSQALIKFYPNGEPSYEAVRADVVKFISSASKAKD